jgi:hypothetical protein
VVKVEMAALLRTCAEEENEDGWGRGEGREEMRGEVKRWGTHRRGRMVA